MHSKHKATGQQESTVTLEDDLLTKVIESSPKFSVKQTLDGLFIGCLTHYHQGTPHISVRGLIDDPIPAQHLCQLTPEDTGSQCAIMFSAGDSKQPVIMGLLQQTVIALDTRSDDAPVIEEHAEAIHIHAEKRLSFQCGNASIQMTADGRIELHGSTIVNHATGLNRIRGASVKLN